MTGGRVPSRPRVSGPAWAVRCPRRSLWSSWGGAARRRTGCPRARRPIAIPAASCRDIFRLLLVNGLRQCSSPHIEVYAGSTATIERSWAAAMLASRALSLPVGIPDMSCRKRFWRPCFDQLDVHAAEAVFVLDHDRAHLRIGQQTLRFPAAAVHARGDLGFDPRNLMPGLASPRRQARRLPTQIGPLLQGADAGIQSYTTGHRGRSVRVDVHQDHARPHSFRSHRQRTLTEPAVRGTRSDPLAPNPSDSHKTIQNTRHLKHTHRQLFESSLSTLGKSRVRISLTSARPRSAAPQ